MATNNIQQQGDVESEETVSLITHEFDDINESFGLLLNEDGDTAQEFLEFLVNNQEKKENLSTINYDLRHELNKCKDNVASLETQFIHAKKLLAQLKVQLWYAEDDKKKILNMLDNETKSGKNTFETRQIISSISNKCRHINSVCNASFNSTCSRFQDSMMTENGFDQSLLQEGKRFKKFLPSAEGNAKGMMSNIISKTVEEKVATASIEVHGDETPNAVSISGVKIMNSEDFLDQAIIENTLKDTKDDTVSNSIQLLSEEELTPQIRVADYQNITLSKSKIPREHLFSNVVVLVPQQCFCKHSMKFSKRVSRCMNCLQMCHTQCMHQLPVPCIPRMKTPRRETVVKIMLTDFLPPFGPMVPAIIIKCCNEVEERGLNKCFLYEQPGVAEEARTLLNKFLQKKYIMFLVNFDIHTLCETIILFLRSLEEPLLTEVLRQDFIDACHTSVLKDENAAFYQAIAGLPTPNRDTLAFLMLHLQKVANCQDTKMPVSKLARIFAPILLGFPRSANISEDTPMITQAIQVIASLLELDSSYYSSFNKTPAFSPKPSFFNNGGLRNVRLNKGRYFPSPPQNDIKKNYK